MATIAGGGIPAMRQPETIRVRLKSDPNSPVVVINKSDFDPQRYELAGPPPPVRPSRPIPVHERPTPARASAPRMPPVEPVHFPLPVATPVHPGHVPPPPTAVVAPPHPEPPVVAPAVKPTPPAPTTVTPAVVAPTPQEPPTPPAPTPIRAATGRPGLGGRRS
jgi:hypothetical protein